ncbi:hypothetical protein Vafri_1717 [Volvox africanus]|nr:hypothetical protein Vafri_1717 [Volvox africanus]
MVELTEPPPASLPSPHASFADNGRTRAAFEGIGAGSEPYAAAMAAIDGPGDMYAEPPLSAPPPLPPRTLAGPCPQLLPAGSLLPIKHPPAAAALLSCMLPPRQ